MWRGRTDWYLVYIREAHPTDGWQVSANERDEVLIPQTKTVGARREAAQACAIGLKLPTPAVIDGADNAADRLYGGWPERLYVLSAEGVIVYQGGKGPYGFDPAELEAFLVTHLGPV